MVQAPSASRLSPVRKNLLSKDMERIGGSMKSILKKLDSMRKMQKVFIITFICFFVVAVVAFFDPYRSNIGHWTFVVGVGMTVSFFFSYIVLCIVGICAERTLEKKKDDFKFMFRTGHPSSGKEIRLVQGLVEKKLRELAHEFHKACDAENEFMKGAGSSGDLGKVEGERKQLSTLQAEVRWCENAFWTAHGLASFFGSSVNGSVKKYCD